MDSVKVYVTNFAGHDYQHAERYGELVWITKGYVSFQSLDRVKYSIIEKIKDSSAEDWLLLSGTIIINVIAATVWLAIHGQVKLLVFDKKYSGKVRELVLTPKNIQDILSVVKNAA
jgi:hypothetical protein